MWPQTLALAKTGGARLSGRAARGHATWATNLYRSEPHQSPPAGTLSRLARGTGLRMVARLSGSSALRSRTVFRDYFVLLDGRPRPRPLFNWACARVRAIGHAAARTCKACWRRRFLTLNKSCGLQQALFITRGARSALGQCSGPRFFDGAFRWRAFSQHLGSTAWHTAV